MTAVLNNNPQRNGQWPIFEVTLYEDRYFIYCHEGQVRVHQQDSNPINPRTDRILGEITDISQVYPHAKAFARTLSGTIVDKTQELAEKTRGMSPSGACLFAGLSDLVPSTDEPRLSS